MIKVHKEPKEIQREFRGLMENCEFCGTPTLFWTECKHHSVCPDCAKTHNLEDLKKRGTEMVKKIDPIKKQMIDRIRKNGLPFSCERIIENQQFGIAILKNGAIVRNKKASYGPEEGNLEDMGFFVLGVILDEQER